MDAVDFLTSFLIASSRDLDSNNPPLLRMVDAMSSYRKVSVPLVDFDSEIAKTSPRKMEEVVAAVDIVDCIALDSGIPPAAKTLVVFSELVLLLELSPPSPPTTTLFRFIFIVC